MDTYTKTTIVTKSRDLKKKMMTPLFRNSSFLENESGEGVHEVICDMPNINDRKPVHVGLGILQHSKLLLLRFIDFLRNFLEKDSYSLVYGGNILSLSNYSYFFNIKTRFETRTVLQLLLQKRFL